MTVALITPPAAEPLSLEEVKSYLRIDHDHEDELLLETLKAARQYTEFASSQKLITQLWRQYETRFPGDRVIEARVSPVISVEAVTLFARDGTPTVLSSDQVSLMRGHDPEVIVIDEHIDAALAGNGLEIDLICGMGDLGVDVPDTLKRAILMLLAHWYEFRGAVAPGDQPVSLPPGFETLMLPFRRVHL